MLPTIEAGLWKRTLGITAGMPRVPKPPRPGETRGDVTRVYRRRSGAGLLYSDNLIHQTTRSQTRFLAWYVEHANSPVGLAGKLVRRKGLPNVDPSYWSESESFSLSESELAALRRALQEHSIAAGEPGDGELLILRGGETTSASVAGSREVVRAVVKLLGRPDVLASFAREDLGEEIIAALQVSIRIQELRRAVDQLRQHLNGGDVLESVYQTWCSTHSWAFGNAHTVADDIRLMSRTDAVDMLLPRVLTGFRDIVELKRPDRPVLLYDKGWYWSAETAKAIGQCHMYMDHLHEDAQNGLRGRPDLVVYHPHSTIIIGRSTSWETEQIKALEGLNQRLNGIKVMTYDQLLAHGDELLRVLSEERSNGGEEKTDDIPFNADPDDIPF